MSSLFHRWREPSSHLALLLAAALAMLLAALPAQAAVTVHFHSFNGSVLFGRFPHTFVVFEGTLDDTGTVVNENFGFTAKSTTQAISGPAEHDIVVEEPDQIRRTNRHFSVVLTDAQYRRLREEVETWRNQPGRYYSLDTRNCVHFVARMAELIGIRADVPANMVRRPRAWLNYVTRNNPHLGADEVR
ncbi:hypothetical protein M3P36_11940 [Altererythrobacter sp. KTW20L]|uniref:hypothetical protein n=1 Tax=Altererythrobacter sp. KTW20L TaxID=2942210 RepID=UPI0020C097F8|nr:hypothetical protein [Altererythrobacter sp. KTW20L]MCL6251748.1 hypothetical protein [Altererythrobacter sp. KTW20L]